MPHVNNSVTAIQTSKSTDVSNSSFSSFSYLPISVGFACVVRSSCMTAAKNMLFAFTHQEENTKCKLIQCMENGKGVQRQRMCFLALITR